MSGLTREVVCRAVTLYGEAWKNQDEGAIAALFTEDGRYIERNGTDGGTFCGREAIKAYWAKQIIAKQSDIAFEHVVDDMILDSLRGVATVKWVASFMSEGRRVEFTQIALLSFVRDGEEEEEEVGSFLIAELEEYWHSWMTDKRKKGEIIVHSRRPNKSKDLQAALSRIRQKGTTVPCLADYIMP